MGGAGLVAAAASVIGTCIETLTEEGLPLPADTNTHGNYAICHWMYYKAMSPEETSFTLDGTVNLNWGELRYFNEYEWGAGGQFISGANI